MTIPTTCSADGCDRRTWAQGLCKADWFAQQRKRASQRPATPTPDIESLTWLTVTRAAHVLDVARPTVEQAIADGALPARRRVIHGHSLLVCHVDDVLLFSDERGGALAWRGGWESVGGIMRPRGKARSA